MEQSLGTPDVSITIHHGLGAPRSRGGRKDYNISTSTCIYLKASLLLSSSISVFFLVFGPSINQKLLHAKRAFCETQQHMKPWTINIPCWEIIHLQV